MTNNNVVYHSLNSVFISDIQDSVEVGAVEVPLDV